MVNLIPCHLAHLEPAKVSWSLSICGEGGEGDSFLVYVVHCDLNTEV